MVAGGTLEVDGRSLKLTNLDKALYPSGFTKAEVVDYYARVAPALLPHVAARPMSFQRFPDGTAAHGFFAKNAPRGTPDWVRTVNLPAPGSAKDRERIDYVVVDDLATLLWAANLAGLELHVPQWRVSEQGEVLPADLLVLDLDPGPPATILECIDVALLLRDELAADGLHAWPKTSGSKGLQLYVPIEASSPDETSAYARGLAVRLEERHPALVVSRMTRALRPGKVLVDWSQNNGAKTTVAPYSLRARQEPTVSTPITWEECEAARDAEDLRFRAPDVLTRVERLGDLLAPLLTERLPLPAPRTVPGRRSRRLS